LGYPVKALFICPAGWQYISGDLIARAPEFRSFVLVLSAVLSRDSKSKKERRE